MLTKLGAALASVAVGGAVMLTSHAEALPGKATQPVNCVAITAASTRMVRIDRANALPTARGMRWVNEDGGAYCLITRDHGPAYLPRPVHCPRSLNGRQARVCRRNLNAGHKWIPAPGWYLPGDGVAVEWDGHVMPSRVVS